MKMFYQIVGKSEIEQSPKVATEFSVHLVLAACVDDDGGKVDTGHFADRQCKVLVDSVTFDELTVGKQVTISFTEFYPEK